ncbi:MAG TPA: dehydrogenase [Candidatus Marinimicrobia bacterium]|nr:dehydrogenase [Candidatus Neomarinimicrobiota bacterium]
MRFEKFDTPWRRMAAVIYKPALDARSYGTFEVDATKALVFIEKKKAAGIPVTMTQFFAGVLGRAIMEEAPHVNAYIKRGKAYPRPTMDIFISVNMPEKQEMGGFVIRRIDEKTIDEICAEMGEKVKKTRNKEESGVTKNKYALAKIPWPLRRWVFVLIRFITVTMGFPLKRMKIDANSFGSAMISNIGTHNLHFGFAALFPASNLPLVLIMGKVEKKPVVRDGEIVIRDILPLAATLDHRIYDGAQGGMIASAIVRFFENPELLDEKRNAKENLL